MRSVFDELPPARLLTRNAAATSASSTHGTQRSDDDDGPPAIGGRRSVGGRSIGGRPAPLPEAPLPDGPFPDGAPSGFQPGGGPWGRLPGAPNGAVPPASGSTSGSIPGSRSVWRRLMPWPAPLCVGTHATAPVPHRRSALVRTGDTRAGVMVGAARGGVGVSVPNAAEVPRIPVARRYRAAVRTLAANPAVHPAVLSERPAPGPRAVVPAPTARPPRP